MVGAPGGLLSPISSTTASSSASLASPIPQSIEISMCSLIFNTVWICFRASSVCRLLSRSNLSIYILRGLEASLMAGSSARRLYLELFWCWPCAFWSSACSPSWASKSERSLGLFGYSMFSLSFASLLLIYWRINGSISTAIPAFPRIFSRKSSSLRCELLPNDCASTKLAFASTTFLLRLSVRNGVLLESTYAISFISFSPIMLSGRLRFNIFNNWQDLRAHRTKLGPRSDSLIWLSLLPLAL